jgi:hypothetical protein
MPYSGDPRARLGWIVTADHAIPPAAQLAMAQHAQAQLVKVDASTCGGSATPQGVTRLIVAAAHSTS